MNTKKKPHNFADKAELEVDSILIFWMIWMKVDELIFWPAEHNYDKPSYATFLVVSLVETVETTRKIYLQQWD